MSFSLSSSSLVSATTTGTPLPAISLLQGQLAAAPVQGLCIPDARFTFFASKQDYLAFKAAWKALTNSGSQLTAACYTAHAILMGRDLYRTFSPNRRPHMADRPYQALVDALELLVRLTTAAHYTLTFKAIVAKLPPEQADAVMAAFYSAGNAARASLWGTSAADRQPILQGTARCRTQAGTIGVQKG